MHTYRLVYGFDFVLDNPKVVGEHEIVAKSMRSAMYKANALMKELGDRNAPAESVERCMAGIVNASWETNKYRWESSKVSFYYFAFSAKLVAPSREAFYAKPAPKRRKGEGYGAYHERVAVGTRLQRKGRRGGGTVRFTTADVDSIRREVGA